uniref:Uncharacterized protein n=1 Tax=Picea glauca TaxID=3330 RepID=A0A124GP57_PICGL|nr:hypothetical protein ABT39_MTgene747 [Picea glauca]
MTLLLELGNLLLESVTPYLSFSATRIRCFLNELAISGTIYPYNRPIYKASWSLSLHHPPLANGGTAGSRSRTGRYA